MDPETQIFTMFEYKCVLLLLFEWKTHLAPWSVSYCYVHVLLLLCLLCSVYSVFIVPTGILRLP